MAEFFADQLVDEKGAPANTSYSHIDKKNVESKLKSVTSKQMFLQPMKSQISIASGTKPPRPECISKGPSKKVFVSPHSKSAAAMVKVSAEAMDPTQQSMQNAKQKPQMMVNKDVVPVKLSTKQSTTISLTKEHSVKSNKLSLLSKPSAKPVIVKKLKSPNIAASDPSNATVPPPPPLENVPRRLRPKRRVQQPVKYFTSDEDLGDKLVGVVVTIFDGDTYDAMFREVKPTTVPGERVSTYSISSRDIGHLHELFVMLAPIRILATMHRLPCVAIEYLHGFLADASWRNLVNDIEAVPPDSIVFNWECCSGCGDKAFPCCVDTHESRDISLTMRFMGFALRSGWTVMCSDFSLKSLIHEWSSEELGPNPFLKVGSCDLQFCLEFVPSDLQHEEVPQQLQVVGELCADKGQAIVTAMSDTIVYTVNPDRPKTDAYDLKVLTVATSMASSRISTHKSLMCSVGQGDGFKTGWAGHVALTYAAGGQLVTSMGHWIELSRIDTSLESVIRVAEKNFGSAKAADFREKLSKATSAEDRTKCIQSEAYEMVTKSAPSRMKNRTKY